MAARAIERTVRRTLGRPAGPLSHRYAGESALACFLEVLAQFRRDDQLVDELKQIDVDEVDARDYATLSAGTYCRLTHHESLPTLRARFLALAIGVGLGDVDAGALKVGEPRQLSQAVAAPTPVARGC